MSSLLIALARWRTLLARHPRAYWLLATTCIAIAAVSVRTVEHNADARRDAWGDSRVVWIRADDTRIGDVVRAAAGRVPMAMVPTGAVESDPNGSTARRPGRAGEVIVDVDVDPSPAAAAIPAGHVAITLEPRPLPPLAAGDTVTLLVPGDAVDGLVIAVVDDELAGSVTVAVPVDRAGIVADAVAGGAVTVAIAG